MSALLSIEELLEHSVTTGEIIRLAKGYGSHLQEIVTRDWQRLRLNKPGILSAPYWSLYPYTNLPEDLGDAVVREIHTDAIKDGARFITTGTWVEPEVLGTPEIAWQKAAAPVFKRATHTLLTLTQRARAQGVDVHAIGAFGPATDSHNYDPATTRSFQEILALHRWTVKALDVPGIEMLWGETACHSTEAQAMAQAMQEICGTTRKPWGINLTPTPNGTLRDGAAIEPLIHKWMQGDCPPSVIGINCVPPPEAIEGLRRLIAVRDEFYPHLAIAIFTNGPGGHEDDPEHSGKLHWKFNQSQSAMLDFENHVDLFAEMGANIIGGCCGTDSGCACIIRNITDKHNLSKRTARRELICA